LNWHGYAWQGCKKNLCCHAKCFSTCVCLCSGLIRLSVVHMLLIKRLHFCTVHTGFREVASDAEKIHLERQFCPSPRLDQAPLALFCLCTHDLYFQGCTVPPVQWESGTVSHSVSFLVYFVWHLRRQRCGFAYFLV